MASPNGVLYPEARLADVFVVFVVVFLFFFAHPVPSPTDLYHHIAIPSCIAHEVSLES